MFAHEDGGPEPDWVKTEREQFADFRDLNKDGKMDMDEIRHWIMPQDYDHAQAEARHLVYESDQDKVHPPGTVCVCLSCLKLRRFCVFCIQINIIVQFLFLFFLLQDQMLTKQEVLENWNMFVGSQATNYGEDLTRNHDELWAPRVTSDACVCVFLNERGD